MREQRKRNPPKNPKKELLEKDEEKFFCHKMQITVYTPQHCFMS
jgi:hypothetical protein